MYITDMTLFIDQVECWPIAILVSPPGSAIVILCNGILNIKTGKRVLQIRQVFFVGKLRIMIADDNESLVFIFVVPFPQRGNYMLTINSAKRPHLNNDNLAA